MPKVQVRRSEGPTISSSPVRGGQMNVQTNETTFGGGPGLEKTAAAFQDTLGTLQKAEVLKQVQVREEAEKQAKMAREIAVQDADLLQAKLEANIRAEGSTMSGAKAGGLQDFVGEKWKSGTEQIRSTIASEEAKLEFDKKSKLREAGLYGWTQSTMASEWMKHQDASDTAYMANEDTLILDNYKLEVPSRGGVTTVLNAPGIELAIQRKEDAFIRMAQRKGFSQAEVYKGLIEEREKTHTSIINRMLSNGETEMASEYFKANSDQFNDKVAKEVQTNIAEEQFLGQSEAKAHIIMDKVGTDLTKIDKYLDSFSDPKERKAVKEKVDLFSRRLRGQLDTNEQKASELLATNKMTVEWLQNNKSNLTPQFHKIAKETLRFGEGTKIGDAKDQDANYINLLEKYSKSASGDIDTRTEAMMNLRTEILASRPKLSEENFRAALSWTTGKEIEAYQEKKSYMDAAMKFLGGAIRVATWPNPLISNFVNKAMKPETKPEDIPALAQVTHREMAYLDAPELIGKTDVTNIKINKTSGATNIYPGQTKSKPDKTVKKPDVPKGSVLMIAPDGRTGYVPEKNAEELKSRGYRVKNATS